MVSTPLACGPTTSRFGSCRLPTGAYRAPSRSGRQYRCLVLRSFRTTRVSPIEPPPCFAHNLGVEMKVTRTSTREMWLEVETLDEAERLGEESRTAFGIFFKQERSESMSGRYFALR